MDRGRLPGHADSPPPTRSLLLRCPKLLPRLARLIERLIGIGLLRRPLFFQARQLIIRTAERNGIPWRARREELRQAAAPLLALSTTPGLTPPDYYLARFHAYEQGNLCWQ